jgi:hypothetical protein
MYQIDKWFEVSGRGTALRKAIVGEEWLQKLSIFLSFIHYLLFYLFAHFFFLVFISCKISCLLHILFFHLIFGTSFLHLRVQIIASYIIQPLHLFHKIIFHHLYVPMTKILSLTYRTLILLYLLSLYQITKTMSGGTA